MSAIEDYIAQRTGQTRTGPAPTRGNVNDTRFFTAMPSVQKAYATKQQEFYDNPDIAGRVDQSTLAALEELDYQRMNRGQRPLSLPRTENGRLNPGETLEVLRAMPTEDNPMGQSVQPETTHSRLTDLPGNFLTDAQTLFRAIPKMPVEIAKTVANLGRAPQMLSEAVGKGDYQAAAAVPGLNLIPGVYTLGNLLEGDIGAIVEHPLFTALDVAPYATGKFFKPPASMLDDAGRIVTKSAYDAAYPKTFRIGMAEAKRATAPKVSALDLFKDATNSYRLTDPIKESIRGSRVGRAYQASLGNQTRDLMVMTNHLNRFVPDALRPDSPIWTNPYERNVVFKGMGLDMDRGWVVALDDWNKTYGDDFAKQHYANPEEWAARRTELSDLIETRPDEITSLPAHEQAFVNDYRGVVEQITAPYVSRDVTIEKPFMEVDFVTPSGQTVKEILPFAQGRQIVQARANYLAARELREVYETIRDPNASPLSPDDIRDRLLSSPTLSDPKLPASIQGTVLEGYVHALLAKGVDARPILRDAVASKYTGVNPKLVTNAASMAADLPWPPLSFDDMLDAIKPKRPTTTGKMIRAPRFLDIEPLETAIRAKNPTLIRETYDRLIQRAATDPVLESRLRTSTGLFDIDGAQLRGSMEFLRRRQTFEKSTIFRTAGSKSQLAKSRKALDRAESRIVPARWLPLVERAVNDRMAAFADELTRTSQLDPETALLVAERVKRGEYAEMERAMQAGGTLDGEAPSVQSIVNRARRDAIGGVDDQYGAVAGWRELHDQGIDPVYVHHVGLGKAGKVHFPGVNISGTKPAWFNERGMDFSAAEGDIALAVNQQAAALLTKKAEDYLNDLISAGDPVQGWAPMAKNYADITDILRPEIERTMARRGIKWKEAADRVVSRSWVKWDAKQYRNFATGLDNPMYSGGGKTRPGYSPSPFRTDDLYIPKNIHDALVKMQEAPRAIAVWDPVMNVFRTSTLLLSPRWQVYNILGNALTATMSEGFGWMKHLPEASKAAWAMFKGETATGYLSGVGQMPSTLRLSLGQGMQDVMTFNELGRQGIKDIASAIDRVRPGITEQARNWGKPIGQGLSKLTDFSVRFNAMVDDTTRIAGYLSAYERAMKNPRLPDLDQWMTEQGITGGAKEFAKVQAERDMRKWAYNWDSMTPWERSVARSIFPFYGFFSHMMRYAFQYAVDHPFRMAVMASFARSELEDWGTALPARLHNMLPLGGPDEQGNTTALNFGGWNPFADIANLATLPGLMSQVNPVLSTFAEQFGIDPRTGEASLYPTAQYNEQTGRLELVKRNPIRGLIENTIPQVQALTNVAGMNPDFTELATTNPGAAGRLLASSVGVPVMVRDLNIPQEIAKTELTRRNAARTAMSEALRQGNTGPVSRYPALREQVAQLQAQMRQNPGQFQQYQPVAPVPGVIDLTLYGAQAALGRS